jgi:hypothetical protein
VLLGAAVLVLAGCTASSHKSAARIYGEGTRLPLVLAPAGPSDRSTIDASTARRAVEQPTQLGDHGDKVAIGLPPDRRLILFGLRRVTEYGLTGDGTARVPRYTNRLAWVGVYQLGSIGPHSCVPPQGPVASLPPVQKHYYDAVIIDPATGYLLDTWNEDASGQILRDCGYTTKT